MPATPSPLPRVTLCPRCASPHTIDLRAYLDARVFVCNDCEHIWKVHRS